jgi:hypothetical protein
MQAVISQVHAIHTYGRMIFMKRGKCFNARMSINPEHGSDSYKFTYFPGNLLIRVPVPGLVTYHYVLFFIEPGTYPFTIKRTILHNHHVNHESCFLAESPDKIHV